MDDLFNLITSNPILLFVIIGAILNFLQKGKEQEGNKQTKNAQPRREKKHEEIDWREIFRQESEPEPQSQEVKPLDTYIEPERPKTAVDENIRSNDLKEQYEAVKRKKDALEATPAIKATSPIYKDDITADEQVSLNFADISKQEAIKGVVWSEVLGKPRSKGSYRASLNTRRRQG